jgi:hypothetical protein
MIEAHGLVKRYGSTMAVNDLSFSIRPGLVTGFLGPNGAGKTTTMRMILGLDAPTQGSVTVGARSYRDLPAPMREVGALLDAKAVHGGRRARDHLLCLARSNGIGRRRVDEVLRIIGLEGVARRRAKGLSLGMSQRLAIAPAGPDQRAAFRATFADALRSEWIKLRSVRSTFWALTATVVLGIALGAFISAAAAHGYARSSAAAKLSWDPTAVSLGGIGIATLAIAVLGVLFVSSEYSSGMIRTSLIAVPKRGRVLAAKSLVFAAATFVVGEATSFTAFFAGQALIAGHAPHAALDDPGVARAVAGAGLALTALAVLSVAAGTVLRHPAAAIACMIAVLFVLPGIAQALPDSWRNPVTEFWPTQAGGQLASVHQAAHTLAPWPGFGVMCLFVAIVYAIAWTLLDRRDA